MTEQGRLIDGRYRLIEPIATGGMGEVWRGFDERLHRQVAVKLLLLPPGMAPADAQAAARRAMREARIAARLHHPHAVAVFDVVEDAARPCLVMELVPSVSLQSVIESRGPLPVPDVVGIGAQVAAALAAAHGAGIVHRDVKPGNVLIGTDGTAKLTDFGISRTLGDATLTRTGMLTGTPAYLAPEVARGADATFASDVFSLGSTLYAAVEGGPPFGAGANPLAVLHEVAAGRLPAPVHAGSLAPLLDRMLQADPARRPNAAQVQRALAGMDARTEDLPPIREAAPPARPAPAATAAWPARSRHRSRRPVVFAAVLVAALLVAAAVAVAALRGGSGGPAAAGSSPPPPSTAARASSAATLPSSSSAASSSTPPSSAAASSPATGSTAAPAPSSPTVPAAGSPVSAISSYYRLMPGDLQDGWQRLTSSYQDEHVHGFAAYQQFWNSVGAVDAADEHALGGNAVQATLTYHYRDGRTVREVTRFGLVPAAGGWLIDSSSVLSSQTL